jgi:hypothetical protein
VPSSLRWQYYLRGLLSPVTDRSFAKIARQVDRLTLAKVTEKGALAAAFNEGRVPAHNASRQPLERGKPWIGLPW